MYITSLPPTASFDYIIIGAGSAGCAVAARLTQNTSRTALLLEAVPRDTSYKIRIPIMVAKLLSDPRYIWPYVTEPQAQLDNRRQNWTRGKVIGGCSSINGNLFVRGDPAEYDSWRDHHGCPGWGYADLLPIFKRLEHCPAGDPATRGRDGPVNCAWPRVIDPLSQAFLASCAEASYPRPADYNDGSFEGAFPLQSSIRNGLRDSAATAYLHPARKRANLAILPQATATRILFDGTRATGVELRLGPATHIVHASREIILSAGPIASPQLLELSGIGNEAVLRQHGIPVLHHLPGVGENLRDHANARMTFACTQPITINDILRSPYRKLREGLRFLIKRQGLLTNSSSTAQMNYRLRPDATRPDMVLRLLPHSGAARHGAGARYGLDPFSGFTLGVTVLQPRSVGSLHIRSADPVQPPAMNPAYLSHEDDAAMFVQGLRIARKIAAMPALKPYVLRETRPGPAAVTDQELLAYLRQAIQTSWHMVGTTRMGTGPMAVVDPALRVHGVANLRVIDSGICPTMPSSNTNIPAIAIGEKGADLLLQG